MVMMMNTIQATITNKSNRNSKGILKINNGSTTQDQSNKVLISKDFK